MSNITKDTDIDLFGVLSGFIMLTKWNNFFFYLIQKTEAIEMCVWLKQFFSGQNNNNHLLSSKFTSDRSVPQWTTVIIFGHVFLRLHSSALIV